jgi:hypothetical protein
VSDFIAAQVGYLRSYFKKHESVSKPTEGSTREILAQVTLDEQEGTKVVEEVIDRYLDGLNLQMTDQMTAQRREYMYCWLKLYEQRNQNCHSQLMTRTLDKTTLSIFDELLREAQTATSFSVVEREAVCFAMTEWRRLHYTQVDGTWCPNEGLRQSIAVQRNIDRMQKQERKKAKDERKAARRAAKAAAQAEEEAAASGLSSL